MVADPKTIEAIYRMTHEQKLSCREIARQLHVCRRTIRKYLANPLAKATVREPRRSKLDPFKPVIRELLDQWPRASSVVIGQRIQSLGYAGGRSILQEYVATLRQVRNPRRAYVRVESSHPAIAFKSTGVILGPSTIKGISTSSTPSAALNATAAGFM